jgi:serine/threonine protein kinase
MVSGNGHQIWDFNKYGLAWCGTRNNIADVNKSSLLTKASEFPKTDINGHYIFIWESLHLRKKILIEKVIHIGGYGTLSKCIRHIEKWDIDKKLWICEDVRDCYIKKPLPPNKSFREEAILQIMARHVLQGQGFVKAVPEVYDIFKLPTGEEVFTMEYIDGCSIVYNYLYNCPKFIKSNRQLAVFFFQVAYYIFCLEEGLGFNHRDMKITNLIFCENKSVREYAWKNKLIKLNINFDLILIDFGFSCIKELRAGNFFLKSDKCPKSGRDFYIFLVTLYVNPVINELLNPLMRKWIEERIIMKKTNIFRIIDSLQAGKISEDDFYDILYKITEVIDDFYDCSSEVVLDSLLVLMASLDASESPLVSFSEFGGVVDRISLDPEAEPDPE